MIIIISAVTNQSPEMLSESQLPVVGALFFSGAPCFSLPPHKVPDRSSPSERFGTDF